MAKVKFKVRSLDRDTKQVYPASDEFVEVTSAFAERIKKLQAENKDAKGWFEFEPEAKKPRATKVKDTEDKEDK